MPPKFYAVAEGRQKGIFATWSECQKQIIKYPRAVYKSFTKREVAEKWLQENSVGDDPHGRQCDDQFEYLKIFTDGSCIRKKIGAGVYFEKDNIGYASYVPENKDHENTITRAETYAILLALKKAPMVSIELFIDSDVSRNCARGAWEIRYHQDLFAQIHSLVAKRRAENLKVKFTEVDGHSNNVGNDNADFLAKRGTELDHRCEKYDFS